MTTAQHFSVKYFTEKDGMSTKETNVLFRDKKGFLWVGTENGLNRFDGNSFDIFRNKASDSNSIAGNIIHSIYQDAKNKLWIGTNEGISVYDEVTQHFQNFAPDTTVLKNIGSLFIGLLEDKKGRIWVGTTNDLLIFNPDTKKFSSSGWASFAEKNSLPGGNHLRVDVLSLIPKSENEFWVFTTFGLYSVDVYSLQFRFYPYNKSYDYFGSQFNYADDSGEVWISLFGAGLLVYNSRQNSWAEIHIPKEISTADNTSTLKSFNGDTLMFASSGNIVLISRSSKNILGFTKFDEAGNKQTQDVRCKDIKKFGQNLWLATSKGLAKLSPPKVAAVFHPLKHSDAITAVFPNTLSSNIIYTDNKYFYKGEAHFFKIPIQHVKPNLPKYFADGIGNMGYLTEGKHFYSYNFLSNNLKDISLPAARNPNNDFELRNIVVSNNKELWIRTVGQGVIHYNPAENKSEYEMHLPDGKSNLAHWLYYDSTSNTLWYAEENNGVFFYNLSNHSTQHFLLNKSPSQKGATIFNITGDKKGNIWMSDLANGIVNYNIGNKKFKYFNSDEGLPSDKTSWLATDKFSNLWVSTFNGIGRINATDYTITNFSFIRNQNFSNNFITANKEGNILIATDSGYYEVKVEKFPPTAMNPVIYLKNILVNNKAWPIASAYEFRPTENNLQFIPGLLNLDDVQNENLEYRLNTNEWIAIEKKTAILFADLPPGQYALFIRQKNNDVGILIISFKIMTPIWRRLWFLISLTIIIVALLFYLVKRRLNIIKEQAKLQEEKSKLEIAFLRNQMNPHFLFNTLNSINSYIIENENDEASAYLTEFSKLVRMMLQNSRFETITLAQELQAMELYLQLESKRLGQQFHYSIALKPDNSVLQTKIPPTIIQPFIENAIWHGLRSKPGEKNIIIDIEQNENKLKITIEDNGIGMAAASANTNINQSSFGMAATIRRLQLFNVSSQVIVEDLKNVGNESAGTRITILINKIGIND